MVPIEDVTILVMRLNKLENKPVRVKITNYWKEFHVSRKSRQTYNFDESLFQSSGNVIIANFRAARLFAQKMNDKRDVINFPESAVRAGQINAMGLIDEILHYVFDQYRENEKEDVLQLAAAWLEDKIGKEALDKTLLKFTDDFPPVAVYSGKIDAKTYLSGKTGKIPHRLLALEELILLWLANMNPAFSPFLELFDDVDMEKFTDYTNLIKSLHEFFENMPTFGPHNENLIDMLHSPAVAEPYSLQGQLDYIRKKWGFLIGKFLFRLLRGLDLITEEEKERAMGAGPAQIYDFAGIDIELERFSPDKEWMPRVVLLAKSTYVWLDQLSKKYSRAIHRLDQIPDEELDLLARWGFTGLWLIGLWERSKASKRIKQLCGNPEAEASAYSLLNYSISGDLGGEEAYQNLKERAWQRGIRMAGDMVPNHMAIDSNWVMERPDWFISLEYSPYPSHTFNGPNLSWNDGVGIYLEDHYYDRTDASVVFKRVSHQSGETKYIYHGNDGTSMPWNDTAQLNYLNAEVREAAIRTIVDVAKRFPVIRFDAAMTLTKRHYQRLWFPEPGSGGDIPTRAEHGLTREQFHQALPEEFWREVVERIAREAPDTLLLAEAFWLMEGYFVRTLGMHRVYNSAFMNMLKNEQNAQYRSSIKNILEFNPEILKRFVNFMNNPDEETAEAQFGKGDKYFGVCSMLVTMPGLPMFGHGQVEGFTEKYGMEYRRAYREEQPDGDLVRRHERKIFPLMKKRYIFAEVSNFLLYDFYTNHGTVNENVFAYSNRYDGESGIVVFNNKFEETSGWIKTSTATSRKKQNNGGRILQQDNLGNTLQLKNKDNYFVIFREHISGLEYIRNSKDIIENGLFISLHAFQHQVFLDFREIEDNVWHHYSNLAAYLNGRGVPSIEEALRETFLRPIHESFRTIINQDIFQQLLSNRKKTEKDKFEATLLENIQNQYENTLTEIKNFTGGTGDLQKITKENSQKLEFVLEIPLLSQKFKGKRATNFTTAYKTGTMLLKEQNQNWYVLFSWLFIHRLGEAADPENPIEQSRIGLDEWLISKVLDHLFSQLGVSDEKKIQNLTLLKLLTTHQRWWILTDHQKPTALIILQNMLKDPDVRNYLRINRYHDILWYSKEAFDELMSWLMLMAIIGESKIIAKDKQKYLQVIVSEHKKIAELKKAHKKSEFQINKLLDALKK